MSENKKEEKVQQNIENLIKMKILMIGQNAKNNPETINLPAFCLGIANKDYPAMTPLLWNSVYRDLGMTARNIRLYGDPANIQQILSAFRSDPRYVGGDVGVGFKDKAGAFLDELDPLAKEMNSINVIAKLPDGRLKGYNTDGLGYALSLEEKFKSRGENLKGKKAVILGAGGTGNSVSYVLAAKGMKIIILNRTVVKAENLCQGINECYDLVKDQKVRFGGEDQIAQEVKDADVVINVSDKGATGKMENYSALAPANLPATAENIQANLKEAEAILRTIPKNAIISDIILAKETTPFLKSARQAGFETLDGIPMVVNQAVEAFWLVNEKELKNKSATKEKISEIMKKATGL